MIFVIIGAVILVILVGYLIWLFATMNEQREKVINAPSPQPVEEVKPIAKPKEKPKEEKPRLTRKQEQKEIVIKVFQFLIEHDDVSIYTLAKKVLFSRDIRDAMTTIKNLMRLLELHEYVEKWVYEYYDLQFYHDSVDLYRITNAGKELYEHLTEAEI